MRKKNGGYEEFQRAMTKAAIEVVKGLEEENSEELNKVFTNYLLDLGGPTELDRTPSVRERRFRKLFDGFTEISTSYEALLDIEVYTRKFAYDPTRVSRCCHLRHNIGAHLNEAYILYERLRAYLTVVKRVYRHSEWGPRISKVADSLSKRVPSAFKGFEEIRGTHVHVSRYDDRDLRRLDSLEVLVMYGREDRWIRRLYEDQYKAIRKERLAAMTAANKVIKKVLDIYFEELKKVMFDTQDHLQLQ